MSQPAKKVLQYLDEAHASELGLVRVLQSQIAMTPRGSYRTALEQHLRQTRDHAERLQTRMRELGRAGNPLQAGIGVAEAVIAQALALGKTPLDLLRGSGGEEKVLKNAKDACATEALEIATYTAIERLAAAVGDEATARLAASIRADEEEMLARVLREIPKLTAAVVGADVHGNGSYDVATTGAGEAVKSATKKAAKQATKAKRAATTEQDLPIARYGQLNADEIISRLPELSQVELAKLEAHERKHDNRATVTSRISTLRTSEPWAGYDELSIADVRAALAAQDANDELAAATRDYERAHKNRAGVLALVERELSKA